MSEQAIRQQIFEIIAGQAGIVTRSFASDSFGMVHRSERWANDWGKFIEFFRDPVTGRIFGCEIVRTSGTAAKLSNFEEENPHGYTVRMYMGVKDDDETDLLFNAKIEALKTLFRRNHDLNGSCNQAGPASAETIDTRMFGGVLCHCAEIKLSATEIL